MFNTLAEVKAVKIRDFFVQERTELLEDALRYPQAEGEADTQIDPLANVKKESIFDALAYSLADV